MGDDDMKLQKYIQEYYNGHPNWFMEEVKTVSNQQRINQILDVKEYLSGKHSILLRQPEMYNGKTFYPRRIVLQYANTILNFQTAYLCKNPITLTGNENVIKTYQQVQKQGGYDRINFNILDKVVKYGQVAEYVYLDDDGIIKSKLFDPADSYPVYNDEGQLIAFIEFYTIGGVDHYTLFTEEQVAKFNNKGGRLSLEAQYANLSGLPIVYHTQNELSATEGRSELADWLSILDAMEDLISKYTDGFYKFMNPIPVAIGQQLTGQGLPTDIAGGGLTLDDGSDFKMVGNNLDYKTFDTLYKTLVQSLLDISSTPAVSMNKTDISNLSEVSIKLLFSLANIKAGFNEMFMRAGMEQRFNKIRQLLTFKGITFTDDEYDTLDVVFHYAMPSNDKEIIDNLKQLHEMGAISLESILSHSPYTTDVQMEMEKIKGEGIGEQVEE